MSQWNNDARSRFDRPNPDVLMRMAQDPCYRTEKNEHYKEIAIGKDKHSVEDDKQTGKDSGDIDPKEYEKK